MSIPAIAGSRFFTYPRMYTPAPSPIPPNQGLKNLPGGFIALDDPGLYYLSSKVQLVADLTDAFRKKAEKSKIVRAMPVFR